MIQTYGKNRHMAHMSTESLRTGVFELAERPCGPFPRCDACPYPSHGFVCFASEDHCILTEVRKMQDRR